MISFFLQATDRNGELFKKVRRTVLPRKGEMVEIGGDYEKVADVFHGDKGVFVYFIVTSKDLDHLEKRYGWETKA